MIWWFYGSFCHLLDIRIPYPYIDKTSDQILFSRAVRGENFLYVSRRGIIHLHLSQWAVYRIVAIDVRSRREGKDLQKVGFYDPIKNQTYLNVPAILYFLERGAQLTGTVQDIFKKAWDFKELRPNQSQFN